MLRERFAQQRSALQSAPLNRALVVPHAHACFDENPLAPVFDDVAVQAAGNAIEIVSGLEIRPKSLGHHAEQRAAVPEVTACAYQSDPVVPDFNKRQSALYQLTAALEQIGRVFGDLFAAVIEFL